MNNIIQGDFLKDIKFIDPDNPTYEECLTCFIAYLKNLSIFSEDDLTGLDKYWEYFHHEKNKSIVLPGEICQHILFICKGAVKHFTEDASGRYIIDFAMDGYSCSARPSFIHEVKPTDGFICVENTYGVKISFDKYKELVSERPAFEQFFKMVSSQTSQAILDRLKTFQSTDGKGRYDLLMKENPAVFNHFPMQDIANFLGISAETLSRLRNKKHTSRNHSLF